MQPNKFEQFKRILIQGLKNLLRNKMMVFASLLVTVITMVVIGTCYIVTTNINHQINLYLNKEYSLSVYLKESILDDDAAAFGKILDQDERIKSYTYVSKEEAFEDYKSNFPEDSFEYIFEGKDINFLPVSFNIVMNNNDDTDALIQDLQVISFEDIGITPQDGTDAQVEVVREFSSTKTVMNTITEVKRTVYAVGLVVTGLLIFFAIILISNTIMLSVFSRKNEIEIMNHIGATREYIVGPFIVEGCFIGFTGSILAYVILEVVYELLKGIIDNNPVISGQFKLELLDFSNLSIVLCPVLILAGVLIGGLGAMLSATKNIKN